jgi:hypothetical protein
LCAALVFALALWGLKKMKVPTFEAMMLAIFLELAAAFAAVPGAKRLDTALAQTPMRDYEYRMIKEGAFEAVEPGVPKLDLRMKCDYWKQFEKDHQYFFPLQKGGLELWQFDGRALDAGIEAYIRKHPEQRRRR